MAEHVQRLMPAIDAESLIEHILCARQLRTSIFGEGLFADPPWDIVLTLYLAQLRNEGVSDARLAEAASISANAVDRWLTVLDREGLVERTRSVSDGQELQVRLSQKGSSAMRRWFAQWLNCRCASPAESEVTSLLGRILGSNAG
jgi:DNA-binding MarR family transcriptional regulator